MVKILYELLTGRRVSKGTVGNTLRAMLRKGLLESQHFGRVRGWLRGRLYEQSPFTLGGLLRQRRRWVWGTLDLLRLDGVRPVFKLVKLLHLASWLAVLPSILVAAVDLLAASPSHTQP